MKKLIFLLPVAFGLALAACDEPGYVSVESRGGYYDDGGADFYYAGRSPYSRNYGPLVYRDNGYYYRNNGRFVIYDQPTRVYRSSDANVRVYSRDNDRRYDRRRDDRRYDDRDRNDFRDRRVDSRDSRTEIRREVRTDLRDGRDDVRGGVIDVRDEVRSRF